MSNQDQDVGYLARIIWNRFVGIPVTVPYDGEYEWLIAQLQDLKKKGAA